MKNRANRKVEPPDGMFPSGEELFTTGATFAATSKDRVMTSENNCDVKSGIGRRLERKKVDFVNLVTIMYMTHLKGMSSMR